MRRRNRIQQIPRRLFILPLCLLCVGCLSPHPRLQAVEERELPKAITIAEQVGFTPEAQLAQVRQCAPSLVSMALNCYLVLAYEVDMTVDAFAALVEQVDMEKVESWQGDGRELFRFLNHTYYRLPNQEPHPPLMIRGNAGSLSNDQLQTLPEFREYGWRFRYTAEQWLEIALYETAPLEPHPMLGERVVAGNIAVVTLEMGVVVP